MQAARLNERGGFLQKTLYVGNPCHICNGFAKVAGLDHFWLLRNNCQPKKSRKRRRSCEREVILEKSLYVVKKHTQTFHFQGIWGRGHQAQPLNNCQLFWCITYARFRLPPLVRDNLNFFTNQFIPKVATGDGL